MILSKMMIAEISAHAQAQYPLECCGMIRGERYIRLENKSKIPQTSFTLDPVIVAEIDSSDDIVAIVHSHPDGPEWPSQSDMQMSVDFSVGMVVVCAYGNKEGKFSHCTAPFCWGGNFERPPLVGRSFRHGVTDCYSLIRDWYKSEKNVDLPEFPRDWRWWVNDADLYMRHYSKNGFRALSPAEEKRPILGDIFLAMIPEHGAPESKKSRGVVTHGGIYLGNGSILHHLADGSGFSVGALSKREGASRYVNSAAIFKGFIRFDPLGVEH